MPRKRPNIITDRSDLLQGPIVWSVGSNVAGDHARASSWHGDTDELEKEVSHMRRYSIFTALCGFMILGVTFAHGQSLQDAKALTAHIPFTFQVGEAVLPPGEYDLRLDHVEMPGVLRVRS